MKLSDILQIKEQENKCEYYKIVEPACDKDLPAYDDWKDSVICTVSFVKKDGDGLMAVIWEKKPQSENVLKGDNFVNLCGMAIHSEWEKIDLNEEEKDNGISIRS